MDPVLRSTLFKVLAPLAGIAIALVMARLRGVSLRDDLRLVPPPPRTLFAWLAIWIGWMALVEIVLAQTGAGTPKPWPPYSPLVIGLRIAAIGVLGPIIEELLWRGFMFRIINAKLGAAGAILITSAAWTAMHVNYEWRGLTQVFTDGLVLGTARHQSRSLYVPILMHMMGNMFSIGQSLGWVTTG